MCKYFLSILTCTFAFCLPCLNKVYSEENSLNDLVLNNEWCSYKMRAQKYNGLNIHELKTACSKSLIKSDHLYITWLTLCKTQNNTTSKIKLEDVNSLVGSVESGLDCKSPEILKEYLITTKFNAKTRYFLPHDELSMVKDNTNFVESDLKNTLLPEGYNFKIDKKNPGIIKNKQFMEIPLDIFNMYSENRNNDIWDVSLVMDKNSSAGIVNYVLQKDDTTRKYFWYYSNETKDYWIRDITFVELGFEISIPSGFINENRIIIKNETVLLFSILGGHFYILEFDKFNGSIKSIFCSSI